MAASSGNGVNVVRVRLYFDFPPPAISTCRMCWLLIDLNDCRIVADLVGIIRERFGYSRKTSLDLFIEDCFLPFSESIYIVRDNDSIRVKAESLPPINDVVAASPECKSNKRTQKRKEQEVEEGHKGRKTEQSQCTQVGEPENGKKKKKKKHEQANEKTPGPVSKPGLAAKRKNSSSSTDSESVPPPKKAANTKTKIPSRKAKGSSSYSDSSTSTEGPPPKMTSVKAPPPDSSSNPKALASMGSSKWPLAKLAATTSGWNTHWQTETIAAANTMSEDVHEKNDLIIRRRKLNDMGMTVAEPVSPGPVAGTSSSNWDELKTPKLIEFHWRRGKRRAWQHRSDASFSRGLMGACSVEDQPNTRPGVSLQQSSEPVRPRDYTVFPLLASPPCVGQKIAFKLLELTEDYCPAVSEYKEGKVIGFDVTTNMIELELVSTPRVPNGPGKFDLVYEALDGSEVVEYAVNRGSQLTEQWDVLLEPRLIVENMA